MRKPRERLLSLLLALVMALGLLPGGAWAAEEAPAVYVTISVEGELKTKQLAVSLTDLDEDGALTVNDALIAAHNAAYDGGAPSGYGYDTGDYGLSMGKLWGDGSGSFGYWKNDSSCWSLADPVGGGDYITAFVYRDKQYYSDIYSYFDIQQKTAAVGEGVSLTLYRVAYDEQYNPVPAALSGAKVTVDGTARGTTDENGQVTLTFDAPGAYVVSAGKTIPTTAYDYAKNETVTVDAVLVPPVCAVTVLTQEEYADYETRSVLERAGSALTWDSIKGSNTDSGAVTGDLSIPSELTVDGRAVAVSWSCDDVTGALSVSNYYGAWGAYVDRPAARDVSCVLTATLTCGDAEAVKEFPLTVKAEGVNEDKETVVTYGDLLSGITSGYAVSADPWVVLEMAAYNGANVKDANGYGYSSVPTALADAAIGEAVPAETLNGVDLSGPYAIYTIPYLSLAYQAAGLEGTGDHSPDRLRAAMVDYLNGIETNYAGTDEIAPVLAALSPWYRQGDSGLDAAVDAAAAWLSGQQNSDGTFSYYGTPNANSTALAVVALSALGIDAHTDSRFIKNYKSAMDGLFSFALAGHSGFGYKGNVTRSALATEQGFRALVSYARFRESGAPYNIYLQAGDSEGTAAAPGITAAARPAGGGSGSSSVSRTVSVSVMVPPEGGEDGQYTYRHDSARYTNLLGGVQRVSVDRETSALEVLTGVLDGADISYTVSGGYVSRIGELEELDHGPNSGWQYMVDGTAPGESADTYTFSGSAKMVWYYTDDYTRETSSDAWSGEDPQPDPSDETVTVTENRDGAYAVSLPGGGAGPARVVIPDAGGGGVVVIVHGDGSETVVKKSLVENGTARLLLEKDAVVRVVERGETFADVARTDWSAGAVDFVSSRGLFSGVSEGVFAPDLTLSRGMAATVLYALEEPGDRLAQGVFDDVPPGAWYAQGLTWAAGEGIVSGYGDGLMGPEDPVTREQLALMLYRYARKLGLDTTGRDSLDRFADRSAAAPWAVEAMGWAVDAGLMSGRPDGTLDPAGTATRAEAAVMVRQLVALMLG